MNAAVFHSLKKLSVYLAVASLVACGGGGGGSKDNKKVGTTPQYSISGNIVPAYSIDVDVDTNDPSSGSGSNDDFNEAQPISSATILHGFASAQATGALEGRFGSNFDEFDVYSAKLRKGQLIQLQIVDWNQFAILDGGVAGDLDLYLVDDKGVIAQYSSSTDEFEVLQVPQDGSYFVVVNAYEGISKYVLQVAPVSSDNTAEVQSAAADFVPNEMIVKYKPSTNISAMGLGSSPLQSISLKHSNNSTERATLATIQHPQSLVKALHAGNSSAASGSVTSAFLDEWKLKNANSFEKYMTLRAIKTHSKSPDVEYASPNYIDYALAVPNDPFYTLQWHYPLINLPQAWDITTGKRDGKPVIVAVIDTGVVLGFSDIKNQLVPGYDFISSPTSSRDGDGIDPNPDDVGDNSERGKSSWHGSHVAGTVAAQTNNDNGVSGVSWNAKIMPLRVLGADGASRHDVIQAILFAAGLPNDSKTVPAQKADVINMSLGGKGPPDQDYLNAIQAARNAGVIVVAAAGNDNNSQPQYPASIPGVISVSAVGPDKQKAPYSSFGEYIDVAAPGGDKSVDLDGNQRPDGVLSLSIDDTSGERAEIYYFSQGTSMASPHIAGVMALMRAVNPDITPSQVDKLLSDGSIVDDLGETGWDQIYGHGLINAYKAVQAAQSLVGVGNDPEPVPSASLVVDPVSIALGKLSNASFRVTKQGTAPLKVTGVSSSAAWLSATPGSVDGDGFGQYQVTANRAGLSDGNHRATLTLTADNNTEVLISVTLDQGSTIVKGELAKTYVFLLSADNFETIAVTEAQRKNNNWSYNFAGIKEGEYYLLASSDVDFNFSYCDPGEVCGSYPNLTNLESISVKGGNITGAHITMDLDVGIGAASASAVRESVEDVAPERRLQLISGAHKN